jgi:hypothetical protein
VEGQGTKVESVERAEDGRGAADPDGQQAKHGKAEQRLLEQNSAGSLRSRRKMSIESRMDYQQVSTMA